MYVQERRKFAEDSMRIETSTDECSVGIDAQPTTTTTIRKNGSSAERNGSGHRTAVVFHCEYSKHRGPKVRYPKTPKQKKTNPNRN